MYVNQQGLYVYNQKPTRCKACGSHAISQWSFGLPNKKVLHNILNPTSQRQYKLGGCSMDERYHDQLIKRWSCNQCEMDFYSEMEVIDGEKI